MVVMICPEGWMTPIYAPKRLGLEAIAARTNSDLHEHLWPGGEYDEAESLEPSADEEKAS
jgi:hypothetical protein